jgi:hypothetical protein
MLHINMILSTRIIRPWDRAGTTLFWNKLTLPGIIFESFTKGSLMDVMLSSGTMIGHGHMAD